eukprot:1003989-Alexandrium_andersonii.AAC.1
MTWSPGGRAGQGCMVTRSNAGAWHRAACVSPLVVLHLTFAPHPRAAPPPQLLASPPYRLRHDGGGECVGPPCGDSDGGAVPFGPDDGV